MTSVKKNFMFQISYQILTMILPFITSPYISRVLGAEKVGIYSYTYTIASYFVYIAALGINNHGSRVIAQSRQNKSELNATFSSLFADHLIVSLCALAAYSVYVFCFCEYPLIALAQGFIVMGAVLDINWLFFGLEKFKLTVTRNTIVKILTVICVFIFVKSKDDLLIYTIIMAAGTFISQSVIWFAVKGEVRFVKPSFAQMKSHIKPLFVMFIAVIAVTLYRTMDKVMLGDMCDMIQVGCYENADKLIMYPVSIITALGTIMLPRMSHLYKSGESKSARNTLDISIEFALIIAMALCFGLVAVANDFSVIFFGEEFELTGSILSIIAFTIPFMAFNNVLRTQYIIPQNRDRIYMIAVCMGVVANFLLNFFLIPPFGAYGATVGTIAADGLVFVYQVFCVRKQLPIKQYLKSGLYPLIAGIVMCSCVLWLGSILDLSIFNLLIQIGIGVILYCLLILPYLMMNKKSMIGAYVRNKILRVKNH